MICDICGKTREIEKTNHGRLCRSCAHKYKKPKYPKLRDYEWLFQKHQIEKLDECQIATILGCSEKAISIALKKLNIPTRKCKHIRYPELQDEKWVFQKYLIEKRTTTKIAIILGCDKNTAWKALKRWDISPRRRGTEKHSELTKRKMRKARKHQIFSTHHTKPERIFEAFCKKYNLPFKYTGDGSFWIGKNPSVNPDFVECDGKKIAIEIFSYWHDPLKRHCKVRYGQTYEGRKNILKKYGWKLVVFWQEDLEREDAEQFVLNTLKKNMINNELANYLCQGTRN